MNENFDLNSEPLFNLNRSQNKGGGVTGPFGKKGGFDLDHLFGNDRFESFPPFKGTNRTKSRFTHLQPKTPPVNRRNPSGTENTSMFTSHVNRGGVSPSRNVMMNEALKQPHVQNPMTHQVRRPPSMYHNVNSNHEFIPQQQYDETELERAKFIAALERDWGSQHDGDNKNRIYRWLQEVKAQSREEFMKRLREASTHSNLYWSTYNAYYCEEIQRKQLEIVNATNSLNYERQLKQQDSREYEKKEILYKTQVEELKSELKRTKQELSQAKKENARLERGWEEERKKYLADLALVRDSKRQMIGTFRNVLTDKEESHVQKLREKKEGTMGELKAMAARFSKDRESVPLKLQGFRDVLNKVAETEKKHVANFSNRLTNIMDQHEQRTLNSVRDKIFDPLLKDFDVGKEEEDDENDQ